LRSQVFAIEGAKKKSRLKGASIIKNFSKKKKETAVARSRPVCAEVKAGEEKKNCAYLCEKKERKGSAGYLAQSIVLTEKRHLSSLKILDEIGRKGAGRGGGRGGH